MIDESNRKKLIYVGIAFIVLVIISLVGFIIFHKNSDLPPVETGTSTNTNSSDTAIPAISDDTSDELTTPEDDGVTFDHFDDLSQAGITDTRIGVIRYYLDEYANTQSTGAITNFSLDTTSIKQK